MKVLLGFVMVLAFTLSLKAEERAVDKDLALDPSKANADFLVQGEYEGGVTAADGKKKLGAQIIALGGGNFHSVFFAGGLPGAGWDEKTRFENTKRWGADGKTDGANTVFAPEPGKKGYNATITGEAMSGKSDADEAIELKKVSRKSTTLGAKAPDGALVLFDGSSMDQWKGGNIDERKFLTTAHGMALSKKDFVDYTLHVEYMEPFKPFGRDQDRGNSGVYQQNRYEVQVLDSFGLKMESHECGAIYGGSPPTVNMCYPPLSWNTYDIDFTAAKFEGEKKTKNASVTVKHNGVVIHQDQEIKGPTGGGQKETAQGGPIQLQGHGNPVFFQNIWIVEKK